MLRIVAPLLVVALGQLATAQTVNYTGRLYSESGDPVAGALIIPGTFAPGFDVFDYNCVYGDESCNLVGGAFGSAYDSAVAEGNFFPIGSGTFTDFTGSFSGSGVAAAPAGTPIWVFAFDSNFTGVPDSFFQVLASSTSPNWQVPASPGATLIDAAEADVFEMGTAAGDGFALSVIPFPEPTAAGLALLGALGVVSGRRRS